MSLLEESDILVVDCIGVIDRWRQVLAYVPLASGRLVFALTNRMK